MDHSSASTEFKQLIAKGKEQGYLTYAEVNDHLPEEKRAVLILQNSEPPFRHPGGRGGCCYGTYTF